MAGLLIMHACSTFSPRTDPDFLDATLDRSEYAAFLKAAYSVASSAAYRKSRSPLRFSAHVRLGERGAPVVRFLFEFCYDTDTP
jgi:hypothetical protein